MKDAEIEVQAQTRLPKGFEVWRQRLVNLARLAWIILVLLIGVVIAAALRLAERLGWRCSLACRQRMTQMIFSAWAMVLPVRVLVRGTVPAQPLFWVSNHVSWIDIPCLAGLYPLSFLSKAELRDWPVIGWMSRMSGTLFIRRGIGESAQVKDEMSDYLRQGAAVLVFPEGTTSVGVDVLPFHRRLFASAIETGTPVQPVALRYWRDGRPCPLAPFIGEDELVAHLGCLLRHRPCMLEVQLLPPVPTQGRSRNEVARDTHAAIRAALRAPHSAQDM